MTPSFRIDLDSFIIPRELQRPVESRLVEMNGQALMIAR